MRIPHWPALVCGLVLAVTLGTTAVAAPPRSAAPGKVSLARANDDADDDSDSEPFAGGGNGFQPVQYGVPPAGASGQTAPAPEEPGFYAPGVAAPNAWPQESPFSQFRSQETYNDAGLWMYNTEDEFDYTSLFSLDYLYGSGKKPGNQLIGAPGIAPGNTARNTNFFQGQPGTYPTNYSTNIFPNVHLDGLKVLVGREHPDGSGITLSGFALFEQSLNNYYQEYRATPGDTSTLRALYGIVVLNPNGSYTVLPFDSGLFQQYTQAVYGADMDFWFTPFFQRDTFKFKFMGGVKFLRIHEEFYLQGDDSGLGYVAGAAGGGGGATGDPTLITGPFTTLPLILPSGGVPLSAYSTYLRSSTTNNLVGPQIGVRYELGGDKFKIWGQTKIAVAADVEQSTLNGNNWNALKAPGPANTVVGGPDLVNFTQAGVFNQKITNTHISPIFDTAIYGEFNGFALIPWVNHWQIFKNAKMRVGWNYVFVNEVARAAANINYNIHTPTINTSDRTSFGFSTVNFAVDWRF
jgi:hypothetical protein